MQCGFCTPGMLMTARDIVMRLPQADEKRIRLELSGNLCRCTGYVGIVAAVRSALTKTSRRRDGASPARSGGIASARAPARTFPQFTGHARRKHGSSGRVRHRQSRCHRLDDRRARRRGAAPVVFRSVPTGAGLEVLLRSRPGDPVHARRAADRAASRRPRRRRGERQARADRERVSSEFWTSPATSTIFVPSCAPPDAMPRAPRARAPSCRTR